MEIRVVINLDNDAFATDEACGEEINRLLVDCGQRVVNKNRRAISRTNMRLHDVNGNTCGSFEFLGSTAEIKELEKR